MGIIWELSLDQVQENMSKHSKRRALRSAYIPSSQLSLVGFETPFYNQLDSSNRWVVLSKQIPWDELVGLFNKHNPPKKAGRPSLNPRVLIGAVIIKHMLNLDDRETIAQITENMYLQYFIGYSSYIKAPPFDASLFVDIRKRLGQELLSEMNELIHGFSLKKAPSANAKGKKTQKTLYHRRRLQYGIERFLPLWFSMDRVYV